MFHLFVELVLKGLTSSLIKIPVDIKTPKFKIPKKKMSEEKDVDSPESQEAGITKVL